MTLSRRQFLAATSAASTLAALELTGCMHSSANVRSSAPALATLRSAGDAVGILAGAAVAVRLLRSDAAYAALVAQQCGIVVAENEMKFRALRPDTKTFFFDDADFLMGFAERNGIKVRGHNFVWHRSVPGWVEAEVTAANAEQMLTTHIETVAGRYAGRMHSWDVVNEAVAVKDGLPGGFRDSVWQKLLPGSGAVPGYIEVAYRAARRADPHALLVYNDYGIEGEDAASEAKRGAVMGLLRGMQARNIPLDGLGVQSHLSAGSREASGPEHSYGPGLRRMMAEVRGMGLKVLLTEMDVNDRGLPADVAVRDAAVARVYASYLRETLAEPAVIALLTWGITDRATWLNGEDSRKDKLPERCLPFDAELKPVGAFDAEVAALQGAPRR